MDAPVNIHLTGCHNSCAQHYIADIGLLGAKVERGEDMVEGYDLHVGGGAGANQAIGRLIRPAVAADELPPLVLRLLQAWMAERAAGRGLPGLVRRHERRARWHAASRRRRMNAMAPVTPVIPENAPFSPAQRAWLNGFLAGLYGGAGGGAGMSVAGPVARWRRISPGTTRRWRWTSAWRWRRASRSSAS